MTQKKGNNFNNRKNLMLNIYYNEIVPAELYGRKKATKIAIDLKLR